MMVGFVIDVRAPLHIRQEVHTGQGVSVIGALHLTWQAVLHVGS